jgi:hypothetical protein
MSEMIIKQPDGKYAVWSNRVDAFTLIDATPDEIVEARLEGERRRVRERVNEIVAQLDRGEKPYGKRTDTWEEALEWYEHVHGEKFDLEAARLKR